MTYYTGDDDRRAKARESAVAIWHLVRRALGLPKVDPFVSEGATAGEGSLSRGKHIHVDGVDVELTEQVSVLLSPRETELMSAMKVLGFLAAVIDAKPFAFGRLQVPSGVDVALLLWSGEDTFSMRIVSMYVLTYDEVQTRIDILCGAKP